MKKIFLLIILFYTFAFPLLPIKKDTKLIMDKLQRIEEILTGLEQKTTIMSTEFSDLYKKVKIMEERIAAITQGQADVTQSKESMLLSLQFLKEEINELKNSINKINDRFLSLPNQSNTAATTSEGEPPVTAEKNIPTAETIYYTAYSDYLKKNYQLAIEGFKQYVNLYPTNDLTDNAYYWIGECYYTQKMYQDAVNAFSELIEKFKNGDKIPDATLKKGFALIEMGKESEGIKVLKELISGFPLSDEAKLAQQKIKDIIEQ